MKTLYLDIFSGLSGDMFIGALIDLGVSPHKLARELEKLKLDGYHLHVSDQERQGIAGIKFDVHLAPDHDHHHDDCACEHEQEEHSHAPRPTHHDQDHSHAPRTTHHDHPHADSRNFRDIKKLITQSKLSPWVKKKSIAVFQRIADAEGKIHGKPASEVHFHEVGAVDSIVDIVGAGIGLELLGKPRVLASPVVEGTGWIRCAHGRFPIPAPATLAILGARKIPITQCAEPNELITPTGAALLAEFVEKFAPMTGLVAEKIGFGLGTRENQTRPNVVRAVLGTPAKASGRKSNVAAAILGAPSTIDHSPSPRLDWETDHVAVLETNLDDVSSEILGGFLTSALAAGALDVFHTPIQMKKNRPGVLLTVLCHPEDADRFSELLLRETTAFGVRRTMAERRKLRREFVTVKTRFGPVSVKVGKLNGQVIQAAPEYESCLRLAGKNKVPLRSLYAAAEQAFRK